MNKQTAIWIKSSWHISLALVLSLSALHCSSKQASVSDRLEYYTLPEDAQDGWTVAHADDAGLDASKLSDMVETLSTQATANFHSALLVKNGQLVLDHYFEGENREGTLIQWNRQMVHRTASVTKSVTSLLFGIAKAQGLVGALSAPGLDYFPQYADLIGTGREAITLEHLLTMTSGLAWDEWSYPYGDARNDVSQLFSQADPIRYVWERPLQYTPGSTFHYNSGNTNILGAIIYQKSGQRLHLFARGELFNEMDIEQATWYGLSGGHIFASGDLQIIPRDMAKIGQLVLQNGQWQGRQLVPASWIEASVQPRTNAWGGTQYGYQWWLETFATSHGNVESISARGWGEQYIFIFPGLDAVFVTTAGHYNDTPPISIQDLITQYVLPALQND